MSTTLTPNHATAPSPVAAATTPAEGPGVVPRPAPRDLPGVRCEMEMRDWWRERQGAEWRLL